MFNSYDGFFFLSPFSMKGRISGKEYELSFDTNKGEYRWISSGDEYFFGPDENLREGKIQGDGPIDMEIDLTPFYSMKVLFDGIIAQPTSYPSILLRGGVFQSQDTGS